MYMAIVIRILLTVMSEFNSGPRRFFHPLYLCVIHNVYQLANLQVSYITSNVLLEVYGYRNFSFYQY